MNDALLYLQLLGKEDMSNKFTPKPDTGTLFPNTFKKNDSHPDFTGTYATADGTVRELAAWQNGDYISIRFKDQYIASDRKSA